MEYNGGLDILIGRTEVKPCRDFRHNPIDFYFNQRSPTHYLNPLQSNNSHKMNCFIWYLIHVVYNNFLEDIFAGILFINFAVARNCH